LRTPASPFEGSDDATQAKLDDIADVQNEPARTVDRAYSHAPRKRAVAR
jgi:hypothetical protein